MSIPTKEILTEILAELNRISSGKANLPNLKLESANVESESSKWKAALNSPEYEKLSLLEQRQDAHKRLKRAMTRRWAAQLLNHGLPVRHLIHLVEHSIQNYKTPLPEDTFGRRIVRLNKSLTDRKKGPDRKQIDFTIKLSKLRR
ncbi:MAG TPA: hypothetical protein VJH23_02030 [archaeon]|nr:hypothetical protein [archaeon]